MEWEIMMTYPKYARGMSSERKGDEFRTQDGFDLFAATRASRPGILAAWPASAQQGARCETVTL